MDDLRKEALNGSDILIDDNHIMLIRCNTTESLKYFAPEFIKKNIRYYDLDSMDFIVLVDKLETKGNEPVSYVILIQEKKEIRIIDNSGIKADLDDIIKWYPQVENVLFKDMKTKTFYSILYNIKKGEKYDVSYIQDFEPLIENVRYNQTNPGKSVITIRFGDFEDFLKLFDLEEHDIDFVSRLLNSRKYYYGYDFDFYSYDFGSDDWKQGYVLRDFNQQNLEKLSEILKYVSPITNLNSDEDYENASTVLDKMFERDVEDIISEYVQVRNECAEETARKSIESDFNDVFNKYYIFEVDKFDKYITSVDLLLNLYKNQKDKTISLEKLVSSIGHSINIGPFEDYRYEYGCDDLDLEGFNRDVDRVLNRIMERIEDSDEFPDMAGTREIFKTLEKHGYQLKRYYSPPKSKDIEFMILNVDPTDNKLIINVKKEGFVFEKRKLTLDQFNSFLHNYELFESRFFLLKKKL